MPNMFGGDQYDEDYAPIRERKPNMVHVKAEKIKLILNETSVEVVGEYNLYNDAGQRVEQPTPAHLMKIKYVEDKESEVIHLTLTKEAFLDIIEKVNKYPDVYSFDRNAH